MCVLQSTNFTRQLGNGCWATFGSQKTALETFSQSETWDPEYFTTLALPVADENLKCLGHYSFFFFFPDFFPCESQHEPRAGDRATMGREKGWGEAGWVDALSGQGVLGCRDLSAGEYDSRGNSCLMVKEQRKSWVGVRKESRKP